MSVCVERIKAKKAYEKPVFEKHLEKFEKLWQPTS